MDHIRIIAALSALMAVLAPTGAFAAETPDLDAIVEFAEDHAEARLEGAGVPGLVFVAVDASGAARGLALGDADPLVDRPMGLDTPLRVGSISKPVTAAIALELADRDGIDLDHPVDRYLETSLDDRFGPASTIRSLLAHRGGHADAILGSHHPGRSTPVDLDAWAERVAPRAIAPDVVASYSSVGYTLVGAAVAGATGADFDDAARELLFDPVGMTAATFRNPPPADVAVGHRMDGTRYALDAPDLWPAAGLVASADDIGGFMAALLSGSGPLAATTRDGLLTLRGAAPEIRGATLGLTEWTHAGRRLLYHEGNGIGTTSRLILLPDAGLGIFTAVNAEAMVGLGDPSPATRLLRDLHEQVVARFAPGAGALPPPTVIDGATPASDLAGVYVPTRVDLDSLMRLEALVSQTEVVETDGGVVFGDRVLQEAGPGRYRSGNRTVVFVQGPDGVPAATLGGTASYRRAALWERMDVNLAVLGGALGSLIVGAALAMAGGPRRLRILGLSTVAAWLTAIGTLGAGMATARVMDLFTGPTPSLRVAGVASVVALVASGALGWSAIEARSGTRRRHWIGALAAATAGVVLAGWFTVWGISPL